MSNRRVLVVDDEAHIRRIIKLKLEDRGMRVEEARDGEQALAAIERAAPDVLVLDIMMPKLDGISLLRQLRGDPRWAKLPVIMLTAVRERDDMAKADELGVFAYVRKPFRTDELCELVERAAAQPAP
ncbi:MAG: hypothetical protein KatS3mg102_1975 [Planctomycetota bacterium]|nr:MAG: hypothetical protein KatS3mg102_1975 [Planctomycetota bacterium]